jgi:SAM-dependent methyltransferase
MWKDLIATLDLAASGDVLMAGPHASDLAIEPRGRARWSNQDLVAYVDGTPPADDATARSTGLALESVGLVVLADAFGSVRELGPVLREAYRILEPGGNLLVTEFNAEALLSSAPQRYPQRILADLHPEVAEHLTEVHPPTLDIAIELVRAGFKDADAYSLDFPLGHFTDYRDHAAFVAAGGWRGVKLLTEEERVQLQATLPRLLKSVRPVPDFDDTEPVTVATGMKPF